MLTIRRSSDRGWADHGWLKSHHTFSFAGYRDPRHVHFGPLRVINEDRIQGGRGFAEHPHNDMEIISYVVEGALQHADSMGHKTVIRPGEVQRMSAGTGVVHSEYNASGDEIAHFLQIWIIPDRVGLKPGYGQKDFSAELTRESLVLAVSKAGRGGSIAINQDADLYLGRLKANSSLHFGVRPERDVWVQVIKGELNLLGESLKAGDGAAIVGESAIDIVAHAAAEFILFDLTAS